MVSAHPRVPSRWSSYTKHLAVTCHTVHTVHTVRFCFSTYVCCVELVGNCMYAAAALCCCFGTDVHMVSCDSPVMHWQIRRRVQCAHMSRPDTASVTWQANIPSLLLIVNQHQIDAEILSVDCVPATAVIPSFHFPVGSSPASASWSLPPGSL